MFYMNLASPEKWLFNMKKIAMIGNSHIDPVWLWNQNEGVMEVKSTFMSALDRMNEFEDFIFSASSVAFYKWMERDSPEIFEQIKRRVKENRWELVGGWFIEPDCNLAGGEGLVRQGLYSQRYLKKTFGKIATVGYAVDSFGHVSTLPQILAKSGLDSYVFMRPHAELLTLPSPLFVWKTPDGSEVLAYRIQGEYTAWTKKGILTNLDATCKAMEDLEELPCFYGVGNHGGGPTIDNIKSILELRNSEKEYAIDFSTCSDFFRRNRNADVPAFEGELQVIFDGCFSVDSELKALNRHAENTAADVEKLNAMTGLMGRPMNRTADLERAWELICFSQFHDILAGTSLHEGRCEAVEDYHGALSICRDIYNSSVSALTSQIDTRGDGFPLVLINTNAQDYNGEIVADVSWRNSKVLRLKNYEGQDVFYQDLKSVLPTTHRKIVFTAHVPAMGYAVYRLIEEKLILLPAEKPTLKLTETDDAIVFANEHVKAVLDKKTCSLSSLTDLHGDFEAMSNPVEYRVYNDHRDTWGSQGEAWGFVESFVPVSMVITENGENRAEVVAVLKSANATVEVRYSLDKSARYVRAEHEMISYEKWKLLKMAIPLSIQQVSTKSEMPYGYIDRTHKSNQEYFHHSYVDCYDEESRGLSIINKAKFGYRIHEGSYELTLSRSPIHAFATGAVEEENVHYEFVDQGRQSFTLLLAPHSEAVTPGQLKNLSDIINHSIKIVQDCRHSGQHVERLKSLMRVDCAHVEIAVVKQAEDNPDGLILRLFELNRTAVDCTLEIGQKRYPLSFATNELKTLRIDASGCTETNCLEDEQHEAKK